MPILEQFVSHIKSYQNLTSGYATWLTAGGVIHIAHYDVIDDIITRKLQLTQVHNLHGKSISSAIFAQLTTECHRECLGMSFPLIVAPSHGASGPHLIHASLAHSIL